MTGVLVANIIWDITCEVVPLRLRKCKTTAAGVVERWYLFGIFDVKELYK